MTVTAESRLEMQMTRARALERWSALRAAGVSATAAAASLRLPVATLYRWERWESNGGEARLAGHGSKAGRPSRHALSSDEALALRGLILARSSQGALHFALAVEQFAQDPSCRPETRAYILAELDRSAERRRRPQWPPSWRRAAYPTKAETALFRGRKHAQEFEIIDRRGNFYLDAQGDRRSMVPHAIWEMDDASDNAPCVAVDPDTGEQVLTRQVLWTQDVYSAAILGFTQVARSRDAYRIEDVADHVLESVRSWGLPQILRLEMGAIWAGSFVHGIKVNAPGWGEERWGGLSPLMHVVNVHKSRGKGGVEKSFDLLQAMDAHRALTIGRVRGEFEAATAALVRSHRTGSVDDGFWSMIESGEHKAAICDWFNRRAKERRAFGRDTVVPADLLGAARGLEVPGDQWWRFCPVKRQATVRGGHVECLVDHYPRSFRWRVNGVDRSLILDHGYRVLAAFHPGKPELGCHVFNAEIGARNRDGFRPGELILVAPSAEDVPQVDLSGTRDFSHRKNANAAVTRNYRAIGHARRAVHRQNSDGDIVRISTGAAPAGEPRAEQVDVATSRAAVVAPALERARARAAEAAFNPLSDPRFCEDFDECESLTAGE